LVLAVVEGEPMVTNLLTVMGVLEVVEPLLEAYILLNHCQVH
jgi:hypothetical protein